MDEPRRIRRDTFWIGAAIGLTVTLPLACLALLALAKAGIGTLHPAVQVARYALVFAGLPAFLSGGGVARLAAHRAAEAPSTRTLRTAVRHATPAMAFVGAGLAVLVAVPLGGMPMSMSAWAWVPAVGLVAGAPVGLGLGWLVSRHSLY
jgi:hypothetical protein